MFRLLIFVFLLYVTHGEANLLNNGDFESSISSDNWFCQGNCNIEQSSDSRSGDFSALVTNRNKQWKGAAQFVDVVAGQRYKITAYVKINDVSKQYWSFKMMLSCKDVTGSSVYVTYGETPMVLPGMWFQVGGVHQIPEDYNTCKVYIMTDANIEYLVDDAEAVKIAVDKKWKNKAQKRINSLRKERIRVRLSGDYVDTSMLDIEIKQTSMEFPLGSVMNAERIVDTEDASNLAYQRVFYDNFEWGVLGNALKWKQMQPQKNVMKSDKPLNAMTAMRDHGIKQRCHCAFWGVDDRVQDWVKALSADDLKTAVFERIDNVTALTSGLCDHWDVNNELLHGDFYERSTNDFTMTAQMFVRMKQLASDSVLYLNDYNVLNNGISTVALKENGQKYKDANVPIGGIGVQGHMHEFDIQLIKARLDILQEAGLKIMITEFAINEADAAIKAQHLDDMLTLFYSHPAVEGVLFWGFWDGRIWEEDAPLFNGPDVTPNAAGKAYQNLFHNQWRTRAYTTLLGSSPYVVKGFKGDYSLAVYYKGTKLTDSTFTLTKGVQNINVVLDSASASTPSVSEIKYSY